MKTIWKWLRHQWLLFRCSNVVIYPPLGRLGVWLCDRYETKRYATRVENNIVANGPPTHSGPFAPGGTFNIQYIPTTLPPKRYNGSVFGSHKNLVGLIEFAEKCDTGSSKNIKLRDGSEYKTYAVRGDVPAQVTPDNYGRYTWPCEVLAVSPEDYERAHKSQKQHDPPQRSSYLDGLGYRHLFCDNRYVFTISTETSQEAPTCHGD
jgi:hypothetical protein